MEDVFNQGRMIDDMDMDEGIELVKDADIAKSEGRHAEKQAEIYNLDLDHSSKVLSMQEDDSEVQEVVEVVTTAKHITKVVTTAASQVSAASATIPVAKPSILAAAPTVVAAYIRKRKRVIIRDPEEELSLRTPAETPKVKDKGKGIMVETPKPMKKKDQIELDAEYARKLHEEINRDEFNKDIDWDAAVDNASKRRKLSKEAQEAKDLRKRLEVVEDKDDDVFVEATPLASKVHVVDYRIVLIDNKPRFKIIRADETHQFYISFTTLLKNFDKEDLENLWRIVKDRFSTSKPTNFSDEYLLLTLKIMFEEPDGQDAIWRNQKSVHVQLFLLVERMYLFSRFTLEQLVNVTRLQVKEESEMSLELLRNKMLQGIPTASYGVPPASAFCHCLPEFVDDTVTDYSRPTPSSIMSKPIVKFVKAADCPRVIKTNNTENARKSTVKNAEMYRNISKSPKVRVNQRNWNNLKSQQLGKEFLMQNKACFKCGDFDHLASNCGVRVEKRKIWPKNNYAHKSVTPRAVLLKTGTSPIADQKTNQETKILATVDDEPASLLKDDRQGEAFPTVSSLDARQDRENIAKTSALPHESSPRVTSLDADEGNQDLEISRLKARVKSLKDKERRGAEPTQEDAPIIKGIMEIREELGADKSIELGSNDTEEMVNVLSSMEATNILTSGGAAASVSPAEVLPAAGVPTVSGSFPTFSAIFTTASVVTPYSRRPRGITIRSSQPMRSPIIGAKDKGKEKVVESERLSEQLARDSKIARLHNEEELKMMIEEQTTLKEGAKGVLHGCFRSHAGWKTKHFRGLTLEQIKEKFIPVWKQLEDFVPMSLKEEGERVTRRGLKINQGNSKRMKTSEDVSEEELKGMMQLVPLEEVYIEALQQLDREDLHQLWTLVKETLSIKRATKDKNKELWVELKRMFKPDFED
nr:retrotransposon Orf1 [Tanacetum cinerariifolium]